MKNHIVGGAGSACFHAMIDALGLVLNATNMAQRSQILQAAIDAFQTTLGREVDLSTENNKRHLGLLVKAMQTLCPEPEANQESAKVAQDVDINALLDSFIEDIDLEDENIFAGGDEETFLYHQGDKIAQRYAESGKAFHLERIDHKGSAYLAIGTSSGTHPRFPGQDFNVFCTTNGCRTIKDADSDLIVHINGKQLTRGVDAGGRSFYIRFAPLNTERSWRFWASTNHDGERRDVDTLKFVIKLNPNSPKGYDVTRMRGKSIHTQQAA